MFQIVNSQKLNQQTTLLEIEAPLVASHFQAGQFVIVCLDEKAERIPLTIADADCERGAIKLIIQAVGVSTMKLAALKKGDKIADILGPLGKPSQLTEAKDVLLIAGGVGAAISIPVLTALKAKNNRISSIIGFRNRDAVILKEEIARLSDKFYLTTDDGSQGEKGNVADVLNSLLTENQYDFCYCIGPVAMMDRVAEIARENKLTLHVSLNPIMIDGTGMCGGCRVQVAGKTRFACLDGPDFDGWEVDFAELASRNKSYQDNHKCKLENNDEK